MRARTAAWRAALLTAVVLAATVARAADEPTGKTAAELPLDKVIAALVENLNSADYDARERATAALRRLGEPAHTALEAAAKSDRPERRRRARLLLDDLRLGITDDWPAEAALLVRHYDRLDEIRRAVALPRLAGMLKDAAVPFLLERMAAGDEAEARMALAALERIGGADAAERVIARVKKPANEFQAAALAWARRRPGATFAALLSLAANADAAQRNESIETGVRDILARLADGRRDAAARAAREFAAVAPDEPRFLYLEAETLPAGKEADAAALQRRALALNPKAEPPHYRAAQMLITLGRRRLAAAELDTVIRIPPRDGEYDLNAWLSLQQLEADSGLFQRAAEHVGKALECLGAVGGDQAAPGALEQLQAQITTLQRQAERYPAPAGADLVDELDASELSADVSPIFKDDEKAMRAALADVTGMLTINVPGPPVRVFDTGAAEFRYDRARGSLELYLNRDRIAGPFRVRALQKEMRFAVRNLDCTYIFKIPPGADAVEPTARFELDYRVRLQPGPTLSGYKDVTASINGGRLDWQKAQAGLDFDLLPARLPVTVEGTAPDGRRLTSHFTVKLAAPDVEPAKGTQP